MRGGNLTKEDVPNQVSLQYPLYLDVPMMISFLAALEDGVAIEESIRRHSLARGETSGEARAGFGLPTIFSLFSFDIKGRLSGTDQIEDAEEVSLIKKHTEASLFNKLRESMYQTENVFDLDSILDKGEEIVAGMIIEANGVVIRNPLDEILRLMERFKPFLKSSGSIQETNQLTNSRSQKTQPARGTAQSKSAPDAKPDMWVLFDAMREDLGKADMTDIILETNNEAIPRIILTLLKDFGTGLTIDSMLGANVGVLGKVTAVQKDGEPVRLLRRSILGIMPPEQQDDLFKGVNGFAGIQNMSGYLEVKPPLLQIMPMAIFV